VTDTKRERIDTFCSIQEKKETPQTKTSIKKKIKNSYPKKRKRRKRMY